MEELLQTFCIEQGNLSVREITFLSQVPYQVNLAPGESIGIAGASGVGKSLFLRALADIIPWQGEMRYGAHRCQDVTAVSWRKTISLVPAEPVWWFRSVAEHFPVSSGDDDRLSSLLQQLGFEKQVLQWEVSRLSSGEKQRLALVRSLVCCPRVLLLDEPTANLDTGFTQAVEKIIANYLVEEKSALILVSHDVKQLYRCTDSQYTMNLRGLEKMTPPGDAGEGR